MPVQKLKQFLDDHQVEYVSIVHSRAYTADRIAQLTHISGKHLAKTIMLKKDGQLCMAVLPASRHVDCALFARLTEGAKVMLASESEFRDLFPDCEIGAMPPFGNLYGFSVYVDSALARDKEIAFNAGTHFEIIRLPFSDYQRLVRPVILEFATGAASHAA